MDPVRCGSKAEKMFAVHLINTLRPMNSAMFRDDERSGSNAENVASKECWSRAKPAATTVISPAVHAVVYALERAKNFD